MTAATDFKLNSLRGDPLDLAVFAGSPMLIVNTASQCGFTSQYAALQTIWEKYKVDGLVVIGVPSNDFGHQEPGTADEIASFCDLNFRITFPLTAKVHVRGPKADPLFKWLAREAGILGRPWWNFTKYLIGRDGKLADWFFCFTPPDAVRVTRAIDGAIKSR